MSESSKKPTWRVPTKQSVRARSLRRDLTNAERIIWYAVRAHRLNGARFRRQDPIGPFIVDFVCHDATRIIEIDGGQHFEAEHEKRDARRDRFLAGKGYRVLRFSNHDVMTNRQGVLEAIGTALAASPSPPSPASGGGGRRYRARLAHRARAVMKFTFSWLREHLDTDHALGEIADKLTMIGLEVEHLDDKAKALAPFVIARVVDARQHPNADRLRVCMVDTGTGDPVQVVCGAPNARTGMTGVFSPPGTFIPGKKITLDVGTIRGVESRGMLVSEAELKISDDHDGIIELPADAPVGTPYAAWAGLDDPVFEIKLTPNRPDCTGVHGIARDLAAADIGKFKENTVKPLKGEFPCPVAVRLDFGATPSLCPAFGLRLVRGVRNGPSPAWLQRRLTAIGLRPINALVDITNYITFDRARPLHVFDAAKVSGNLVVRRAWAGETLTALDAKTYTLDDGMCVIADDAGVESLAGIMGGAASGCSEATTDVLIESALWDETNIAQTGRKLGINTDARYRFERGVDPAFMVPGLDLATRMVLELCGGTPSEITIAGEVRLPDRIIDFPLAEPKRLAGIDLGLTEIRRVLGHLGFFVAGAGPRLWKSGAAELAA